MDVKEHADPVSGPVPVVESDGEERFPGRQVHGDVGRPPRENGPGQVDGAHQDPRVGLSLERLRRAVVHGPRHVRGPIYENRASYSDFRQKRKQKLGGRVPPMEVIILKR